MSLVGSLVTEGADQAKYFLSKFTEGERVWVKGSRETVWDLGEVIAASSNSGDDTVAVRTLEGGRELVTRLALGGETVVVQGNKIGHEDMTSMRFVNEPQILENLKQRSYNDRPYTFLGPVLVAVNPLKAVKDPFEAGNTKVMSQSHPYAVAELAYQQLLFAIRRPDQSADSPSNQTVVVSGESGAGKTVSSKLVLNHLVARSGGGPLAEAMLDSNPITESFGNSKTLRNPNSSRFGKLFRVIYDKPGKQIIGASVGTYLLERSRVTSHELGERNYHIFYELLQCNDDALLKACDLNKDGVYKALLPHTEIEAQKKTLMLPKDAENFQAVKKSLNTVGISGDRYTDLMGVVAAVLHLSNVEFDALVIGGNDASKVSEATRPSLITAATLLGVAADELEKVFTELERKVGAQVIKSPVSSKNAIQLLEGVNKSLYTRIFEYMILSVNERINKTNDSTLPSVGVLDIFGFETFKKNDIEQLLINYTNEALQLTFNKQVLEAEAKLYQRENLSISEHDRAALDPSNVIDVANQQCINLLQGILVDAPAGKSKKKKKKLIPGILDVIHEQGRVPAPAEKKMIEKLHKTFRGNKNYPSYHVVKKKARTEFIVKHYAGRVIYTTGNFLIKNVDSLPKTANELFLSSTKETTKAIWDCGSKKGGKKASIVSTFKKQITQLNEDLNSTQCSFIRCIKPNAEMHRNEGWFNNRYITVQLRNLSVPKTADVLKAGLPTRIPYDQLVENYSAIFKGKVKIPELENERGVKSFIAALFFAFDIPRSCYKLGNTKVFFKSGDLDKLEEVLSAAESWSEGDLDATGAAERDRVIERYRSYLLRRRWKVFFALLLSANAFRKLLISQRHQKQKELNSAILLQRQVRKFVAYRKYKVMLHAKKLEEERIRKEKAEAERIEQERLAEEARQRELEKQRQLQEFMAQRREKALQQKKRYAEMKEALHKATSAAQEVREREKQLAREERERREAEEKQRKEEAEKQRQELERLRLEREEQERVAAIAAEEERKAKQLYEEKLQQEMLKKQKEELEKKQKDLAKAAQQEEAQKDLTQRQEYIQYMEEKLEKDKEKAEDKKMVDDVVNQILEREEKRVLRQFEDDDEGEDDDDENPWYFYEDLDLDEIDNVSHDSSDEVRINEALNFLDHLGDDDTDEDSDDSDLESFDDGGFDTSNTAAGVAPGMFKDYNGPFIVSVNLNKLQPQTGAGRRFRNRLTNWKQCFAFVFPAHKKVMLYHGEDKTIRVQFNAKTDDRNPAMLKKTVVFKGKQNVLYVTGAKIMEEGKSGDEDNGNKELIISFSDPDKRLQFADLLKHFVLSEEEREKLNSAAPKIDKAETAQANPGRFRGIKPTMDLRSKIRNSNYTKFAVLNKAAKRGKISKERIHDIMLQEDVEDDDYDNAPPQVVSCLSCHETVSAQSAVCPHCGAPRSV